MKYQLHRVNPDATHTLISETDLKSEGDRIGWLHDERQKHKLPDGCMWFVCSEGTLEFIHVTDEQDEAEQEDTS